MSHETDSIRHPFTTETLEDHVAIHVDNLPLTTITESQSGQGFVVKTEGMRHNGTHTSISPASLYREAAQLIATARAMEAETQRRKRAELAGIREALDKAGVNPGPNLIEDLHAAGLRATATPTPRVLDGTEPGDMAEARAAYRPDNEGEGIWPALRERVGRTVTLHLNQGDGLAHTGVLLSAKRTSSADYVIRMSGQ